MADDKPVIFNQDSAKRIADVVRTVEGIATPTATPNDPNHRGPFKFPAMISGNNLFGTLRRYSWVKVTLDPLQNIGWRIDGTASGTENAVFLNESANNPPVANNTIVMMSYMGQGPGPSGQIDTYAFDNAPSPASNANGYVPVHDHRDNITGGGFAFSCYHPGCSIPQGPFPI